MLAGWGQQEGLETLPPRPEDAAYVAALLAEKADRRSPHTPAILAGVIVAPAVVQTVLRGAVQPWEWLVMAAAIAAAAWYLIERQHQRLIHDRLQKAERALRTADGDGGTASFNPSYDFVMRDGVVVGRLYGRPRTPFETSKS